jgi:DNA-binding ferritin-like protein
MSMTRAIQRRYPIWTMKEWRKSQGPLRQLLADVFALYLKTTNFHWHIGGRHFRDYHLLLAERAGQLFAMTATSPSGRARSEERRFD